MNIETNAMSEVLESQVTAPTEISAMRRFYWSVRREFWENRSLYLAPLAVAALFLVSFVISTAHLPKDLRAAAGLDPMRQHQIITEPYDIAAALIMLSVIIVGVFYCMDALYGERRDRSILFWKSLPVSDGTAVLAKACIPLLILPVVAFAVIVVMHFVMLLLSSAVIAANELSVAAYWSQVSVLRMSLLLLYHLLTVHALWPAPIFGWLLLVSAWAPRAPFLWAFLPPLAIAYLEKVTFNTLHFTAWLQHRFLEGSGMEALPGPAIFPTDPMTQLTPWRYLSTPGLWIGLVIAVAFLAAAVRVRRYRGPI